MGEFEAALAVIRGLGVRGRRVVPLLAAAALEYHTCEGAARALLRLAPIPEAAAIVPKLMKDLDRGYFSKDDSGLLLIEVLGHIGEAAMPAHSLLQRLSVLKGAPAAREAASSALYQLSKVAQPARSKC